MKTPGAVPFRTDRQINAALPRVIAHLHAGGLIAYPTETVYGLGGSLDQTALSALRQIKPRSQEQTFLILVAGTAMITRLGLRLTPAARALAGRHWPGPLTLVLPVAEGSPCEELRGSSGGVGVRWTSHEPALRILNRFGNPITSTSANLPGQPPARSATEVTTYFEPEIASAGLLLLDGGQLTTQLSSTVVDCTAGAPRVLREGVLPRELLEATVPELS